MSQKRLDRRRDRVLEDGAQSEWTSIYHLKNLVQRLNSQLEDRCSYAANQICDGMTDFLGMLVHEFAFIKCRCVHDNAIQQSSSLMLELIDCVNGLIEEMRTEFRPAILDRHGIARTIESETRRLGDLIDIDCHLGISDDCLRFDKAFETSFFRILEEALSNIERHADADKLNILYGFSDGHLILQIADNGKGVERDKLLDPESAGLTWMREQAGLLGATLDIRPLAPSGTIVLLSVPESSWRDAYSFCSLDGRKLN